MVNWRDYIDPQIKGHVEVQIKESSTNKEAILASKYPKIAQLWCAVGNLSKQIKELNHKLHYLEGALKEISPKKTKSDSRKVSNNVKEIASGKLTKSKPKKQPKTKTKKKKR